MDQSRDTEEATLVSYHITLRENEDIAKQPRFSILFLLYLNRSVGFSELQRLLKLTPGNLDYHLRKLKKLGYVSIRKVISWRPLTIVEITSEGTNVFKTYVTTLRKLLENIE